MFEISGVPWSRLEFKDVQAFLLSAGEEGVTWEAKADDDEDRRRPTGETPGRVGKNTIRKAGSGLANQIGGYLILSARWDKEASTWQLPGVVIEHPEPRLWIEQLLRELRPAPRVQTHVWLLGESRSVAVARIEPIDEPPCMTPHGHVYQRVSGETLRVKDPALLAALFERGQAASRRAALYGQRAAQRAFETPRWKHDISVTVTVALAPIARETENIRPRLFVRSFIEAMKSALDRMMFQSAITREDWMQQDAFTTFAHYSATLQGPETWTERITFLIQATWDGALAASVALNSRAVAEFFTGFDHAVMPGWKAIDPLVRRLGGYGPAELFVHIFAAPAVPGAAAGQFPPSAPRESLYGSLPEQTWVQRRVNLGEINDDVLGSIQRETNRAAGRTALEPEGIDEGR